MARSTSNSRSMSCSMSNSRSMSAASRVACVQIRNSRSMSRSIQTLVACLPRLGSNVSDAPAASAAPVGHSRCVRERDKGREGGREGGGRDVLTGLHRSYPLATHLVHHTHTHTHTHAHARTSPRNASRASSFGLVSLSTSPRYSVLIRRTHRISASRRQPAALVRVSDECRSSESVIERHCPGQ